MVRRVTSGKSSSDTDAAEAEAEVRRWVLIGFGSPALDEVVFEAIGLFHTLSALSTRVHGGGETSAGRRSVLLELDQLGERTVPDMARARPVSRQYMQTLVNDLVDAGYVEQIANPRHKRSKLVRLLPAGRRRLRAMEAREARLAPARRPPVSAAQLRQAAETLHSLRGWFDSENWKPRR